MAGPNYGRGNDILGGFKMLETNHVRDTPQCNKLIAWIKNRKPNFSKLVVLWLILNGTAWTWCSYYLAYLGKDEIAETLSKTVVVEILGAFGIYACKALFENISKNNTWPDKPSGTNNDDRDC
jgi:hypothetical protein